MNNDFGITVRPFYFSRIVVDPKDENVIVKAGLYGSISKDGGETFENLGQCTLIYTIWFLISIILILCM